MSEILKTWEALSVRRRVLLAVAVIATLAVIFMIGRVATAPNMALLYGGLDQRAAGEVVAALDNMGVENEIRGDSIFVPSDQRDRVRLTLAEQGLPAQGQAGYELLDNLTGFGTTSEMFQAAYWRAKEGELARTILSVPGVTGARVHIGAGARRPFSRDTQRATAAVTVRTNGSGLTQEAAMSIRFLVALAVANLQPSDVAVIDAEHGVILRPGTEQPLVAGAAEAERRAQALRIELEELLAVRVGEGNVRVSVTVETTRQTQTISERLVDPESQVPLQTTTEEQSSSSSGQQQGVTVASNVPEGAAEGGSGNESTSTQTRETIQFQYSETRRDQRIEAGAIRRLGVAVLINEVRAVAEDGTVSFEPRTPEELQAIQDLVQSAIAYDAERGDTVTVESLRFAPTPETGGVLEEGFFDRLMREQGAALAQIAALGTIALLLGLFVLRPILAQQRRDADDADAAIEALANPNAPGALTADELQQLTSEQRAALGQDAAQNTGLTLPAEIGDGEEAGAAPGAPGSVAERAAAMVAGDGYAAMAELDEAAVEEEGGPTFVERLEEAVSTRTPEVVALMRLWLATGEEPEEEKAA